MADNYLENRMEEYRSGRLASRSRSTQAMRAPRRADTLTLRYDPMTALILADALTPVVAETVAAFTAVGCRVAFTCADVKEGNALAQRSGARYYPATFTPGAIADDIAARWGGRPDVTVTFDGLAVHAADSTPAQSTRMIDATPYATASAPARNIARQLLYLAHPDNSFLIG